MVHIVTTGLNFYALFLGLFFIFTFFLPDFPDSFVFSYFFYLPLVERRLFFCRRVRVFLQFACVVSFQTSFDRLTFLPPSYDMTWDADRAANVYAMPLHNYLCERKACLKKVVVSLCRLSVWKKFVLQVEGCFLVVFGNKAQWSLLRLCLRPPTQGFVIVVGAARTRPSLFNAPSVKVRSDNKSKLHSRRNEIVASFRC